MPTLSLTRMIVDEILIHFPTAATWPDDELMDLATDIIDLTEFYPVGVEYDDPANL